jgi:hypothetical protein
VLQTIAVIVRVSHFNREGIALTAFSIELIFRSKSDDKKKTGLK